MVLIVAAMIEEVEDYLKDAILVESKPFLVYQKGENRIVVTGVGKVNAAMGLTHMVSRYQVSFILNVGFAGSQLPSKIGDLLTITKAIYHDFDLSVFGYEVGQVPKMPTWFSSFKLDDTMNSHDVLLYTKDTFSSEIIVSDHRVAYDMEGAALYHVAYRFGIPILSIKIVSDILGSQDQIEDYRAFEKAGSIHISSCIQDIMEKIK